MGTLFFSRRRGGCCPGIIAEFAISLFLRGPADSRFTKPGRERAVFYLTFDADITFETESFYLLYGRAFLNVAVSYAGE